MRRQTYEKAGRRAEGLAAIFLQLKGYRILERRYKCRTGEIDLIASKKNTLAIVEVKQRRSRADAEDSLTPYGMNRIAAAADVYVSKTPMSQNLAVRFDAIFIVGRWRIIHLQDAWRDY